VFWGRHRADWSSGAYEIPKNWVKAIGAVFVATVGIFYWLLLCFLWQKAKRKSHEEILQDKVLVRLLLFRKANPIPIRKKCGFPAPKERQAIVKRRP
jgi:hypothetical protein